MIAFAKAHGFNPIDDNEADALVILLLAPHSIELKQKTRKEDGGCLTTVRSGSASPRASLASEVF
ncbi:hypothetical protein FACS1894126_4840 [Alphaproteobacteria bacterium]|nr:hypothetical protein FACS1894126_4840 [Alphaproteobacteria bacterium]